MTDAPTLFDYAATQGAARKSDPATSAAAARSMSGHVLRDQQRRVLDVFAHGTDWTAWEITGWLNVGSVVAPIQQNVVARRLFELVENGMLRTTGDTRPGSSSRQLIVYALTDAGAAWLEAKRHAA